MRVELGNVEKLEEVRSLLEDIAERAKNLEEFVPQLTAIRDQLSRIINEMEALAEEKEEEALRRASLAAEYEEDLATLLRELRAERKKNQQLAEVLEKLLEVLESEK
jgi:Zn-dependent oligopeptidase